MLVTFMSFLFTFERNPHMLLIYQTNSALVKANSALRCVSMFLVPQITTKAVGS